MPKQFHDQLAAMQRRVLQMGHMARANLIEGVQSLLQDNPELAQAVLQRGELLNRLDVELERDALDLLALNQPMAQDLRTIGASMKIITYLDRIGRYGFDIAKVELALHGKEHPRKPIAFQLMSDAAIKMLDAALDAYEHRDATKARSVHVQDDIVDGLDDQIFRQCVTYMMEDPRTITACSHFILVGRHLERAADNADKIAEKTLYMITGERRLQV